MCGDGGDSTYRLKLSRSASEHSIPNQTVTLAQEGRFSSQEGDQVAAPSRVLENESVVIPNLGKVRNLPG